MDYDLIIKIVLVAIGLFFLIGNIHYFATTTPEQRKKDSEEWDKNNKYGDR